MKTLTQAQFDRSMFTLRNKHGINSVSAYDLAKEFHLEYTGDSNLEHGGLFYDSSEWQQYEYADAVSVDLSDDAVFITAGQIHRLSDLTQALECCGLSRHPSGHIINDDGDIVAKRDDLSAIAKVEIECSHQYTGIDNLEQSRVCQLFTHYTGELSDCFRDGTRNILLDDLQGYVFRTYILGHCLSID